MGALCVQGAPKSPEWLHSGLSYKRLEQGCFLSDWQRVTTREMDWTGLKLLLEGIEAKVVKKRYKHPRSADAIGIIAA